MNLEKLAKVHEMPPRTSSLLMLLTASLLAVPCVASFNPPILASESEGQPANSSLPSSQDSNDAKYALRGTVINSLTGEAIRGALVQIYFNGQSSVLTGADGKFQFEGLPAGQITISVRKPGFFTPEEIVPAERGPQQAVTGPDSPAIVLKLIPEGVIYGQISEEDGEAIEGVPIQLLVHRLADGRMIWEQKPGAVTDEDGNFRIAELPPGNYFLSAGPSQNPANLPARLSQPAVQGIPLVYYPAGSDIAAAAPISITPGKKTEINLTLSRQPFYRLSGTLSGYAPGQSVNLQLRNSLGIPLPYGSSSDPARGTFRFPGVPAGSYTLQADAPDGHGHSLTATIPLTLEADVSGVHLILLPTATIPIRMRVINSRTGAEPPGVQENYFPATVQLVPRNSGLLEFRYGSQQVGEPGAYSYELQNIPSGTYRVEIFPNGPMYVESAISGTTNLLESDLSVAPGSVPQAIEITLRDDMATLSGNVSSDNQALSATVLAISEHASIPPRIQPTDPSGGFEIPLLPPGAYKILAVDHLDRLEYTNPEAMKKYLSKALEVTLSPDQSAKIDLELVKVRE